MIFARGVIGETYLIGSRSERTNLNVVRMICNSMDKNRPRANGRPYGTQFTFVLDRPGNDFCHAIDPIKLEHDPGWRPLESFETGLEKTILWYIDNADWWSALRLSALTERDQYFEPKSQNE